MISSPASIKGGTCILKPLSNVAGLQEEETVWPFKATAVFSILHFTWCKNFEYPYRVSSKTEFVDIYNKICKETYETKNYWFKKIKNYMINNYSDKQLWIDSLLNIYNIQGNLWQHYHQEILNL